MDVGSLLRSYEMYKMQPPLNGENQDIVIRKSDFTHIPFDPNNTDYQKYLEWLAEGNEPEPADEVLE
jgi:hypothetical protein